MEFGCVPYRHIRDDPGFQEMKRKVRGHATSTAGPIISNVGKRQGGSDIWQCKEWKCVLNRQCWKPPSERYETAIYFWVVAMEASPQAPTICPDQRPRPFLPRFFGIYGATTTKGQKSYASAPGDRLRPHHLLLEEYGAQSNEASMICFVIVKGEERHYRTRPRLVEPSESSRL